MKQEKKVTKLGKTQVGAPVGVPAEKPTVVLPAADSKRVITLELNLDEQLRIVKPHSSKPKVKAAKVVAVQPQVEAVKVSEVPLPPVSKKVEPVKVPPVPPLPLELKKVGLKKRAVIAALLMLLIGLVIGLLLSTSTTTKFVTVPVADPALVAENAMLQKQLEAGQNLQLEEAKRPIVVNVPAQVIVPPVVNAPQVVVQEPLVQVVPPASGIDVSAPEGWHRVPD